ncbi:DUF4190 domain-containing protein [Streptomyces sp. NPDC058872]|uniref:DUF4190 domain-containing protein n=1 Tax=Streptomyces sp. NPDC058872 TaxID=3346661 RepID=UPI0036AD7DC3
MEPTQPPQPPPPPPGGPQPGGWPAPGPYTSPGMPQAAGPYGSPYGMPPRRTTNGLAIGSLVSGVVCCLPPLGLVLGLVALPQIKKKGQAGKGLAIAGIVLSALSCLLLVIGLVTGGIGSVWGDFKAGVDEASRSRSAFDLRTGQCFKASGKLEKEATRLTVVDCARPHDGEVTGDFEVTGFGAWPGEDPIDGMAQSRCETINEAYAMDTWAVPQGVWLYYYMPSQQSWRLGDRKVTCVFASEEKPLSGSLRADGTTLTADQKYFLLAMNPIETVSYQEPEEDPDEDFAANKKWAGELLAAIDGARGGLEHHSWTGDAAAPVAALRKELDTASKSWGELASASSADAYWEAYESAWDDLPEDLGAAARTALGLTDTLPVAEGSAA